VRQTDKQSIERETLRKERLTERGKIKNKRPINDGVQ
jgi:hypothetical protein